MGAVVFFDLDGTITRRDTYVAYLFGYLLRRPHQLLLQALPLVVAVALHWSGRRDNTWLKCTFLHRVLGGRRRAELEHWTDRFVDDIVGRSLRPQALDVIAAHRRAGDHLVLMTASLDVYALPIGRRLGFEQVIATRTAVDGAGRLTGDLDGGNCYGAEKLVRAQAVVDDLGGKVSTVVYTDHHSDIDLLRWAQKPVAVHPTRRLRNLIAASGIPVENW